MKNKGMLYHMMFLFGTCVALLTAAYLPLALNANIVPDDGQKFAAITFDDLPLASVTHLDAETKRAITRKLLDAIASRRISAMGFVNEYGLYWFNREIKGDPDPDGIGLLQLWVDAGLELANHTFGHTDLHATSVEQFNQDIVRGEIETSKLLATKNKRLRYFRHPYLHAGTDLKTKEQVEQFLAAHHYRIAPVTIDNEDYMFAAVYSKAMERGDKETMEKVGKAYLDFTRKAIDYSERLSQELFGRQIRHVVLLHANALNADYFDDVADMMKSRGYSFATLDEALNDEAYTSQNTYVGKEGLNWLGRWAISRGLRTDDNVLDDFPDVPSWIAEAI